MKTAPAPTASTKELLQSRCDLAAQAHQEAADKAANLDREIRAERQAIENLEAAHKAACRKIAIGEPVDAASIFAEKDRRNDRLTGLQALYAEAMADMKPLADDHAAAAHALQEEIDRLEMERLKLAVADANRRQSEAETAFNESQKAVRAAGHALWLFQKNRGLI